MRRRHLMIVAVVLGLLTAAVVSIGAGDDDSGDYKVRAVFDNASFVIPGEDVKVAGVKVGVVDSLDLTKNNKAVVVMSIDEPAFLPFRKDAFCRIALQSLIGEQFIECEPTQKRGEGVPPAAPLPALRSGDGEGQHYLPVESTSSPVGIDLINNTMRLPERERFRLILNEFGAGLAGNGTDLRAAIRRSNPALQRFDQFVKILAEQDRLLARLVDASDEVLEPFAENRKQFGGFIDHAGKTAAATAERGDDLEQNFAKFPAFLRELRPAMQRFGALSDQMAPALQSLDAQASAVNEATARLGPFLDRATPAITSLGDLAERGRLTFPRVDPLIEDTSKLARGLRPLASDLGALLGSFDRAGGVERLVQFLYFYTGATNGEDAYGHYLRSILGVSNCSARMSEFDIAGGCQSNFFKGDEAEEASARAATPADDPGIEQVAPESRTPDDEGPSSAGDKADVAVLDYLLGQEAP